MVEILGHMLGAITYLCGMLCATPPTSLVGAMLSAGYIGEAVLSYLCAGALPVALVSFGLCLTLMVWVALGLRDKSLHI